MGGLSVPKWPLGDRLYLIATDAQRLSEIHNRCRTSRTATWISGPWADSRAPECGPIGMSLRSIESNPLSANSGNSFLHIPSYLKSSASAEQLSCPHSQKSETHQQKLVVVSAHRPKPAAALAPGQKRPALFAADQAQLSSAQVWVARVLTARVWAGPS
jgi:hypothetical protein